MNYPGERGCEWIPGGGGDCWEGRGSPTATMETDSSCPYFFTFADFLTCQMVMMYR